MARRRNPYPGLVLVAALPALLLAGCWRYAANRAPASMHVDASDQSTVPAALPTRLGSPLLSVRRAPAVLSRAVNLEGLVASVTGFLDRIDPTSCVDVSVDGVPVAAKHESLPLRPASNVKLITASVALAVLGPDFRYRTSLRGTATNGVVDGDLYLVGGGDPILASAWWKGSSAQYPQFNSTSIEALADALAATGVTQVTGSVVGDASRYDDVWYAPSWSKSVRFVEGGPISALLVDDSRESNTVSSDDPVIGAAKVFTAALTERGIRVGGTPKAGTAPAGAAELAGIDSQPLPAVLAEMLTTSDNNTAEMVLKELGVHSGGGGTSEAGLAVVTSTLQSWGIPADGVALVDGSGLSDDNRLTCAALLAVLQHQSPGDAVGLGLPVAGAEGGTLSDAFEGTALAGRVHAKTGTLYNYDDGTGGRPGAKSLSGYIPLDGGGAIEFSMLLNGAMIAEKVNYRPIWDAFAAALGDYPSGPSAADLAPR